LASAQQSDGKLLVGGNFASLSGQSRLCRGAQHDGSLDGPSALAPATTSMPWACKPTTKSWSERFTI